MNWLLIVTGVFLLIMAASGAARGLVKMVLSVVVLVVTVAAVWFSAPYVRSYVADNTEIDEMLQKKTVEELHVLINDEGQIEERAEAMKLPDQVKQAVLSSKASFDEKLEQLGEYIAGLVLSASIYLALFLLIYLVLRLIALILEKAADSDGLRFMNRASGALLALLEGYLILNVLALALVLFSGSENGLKLYAMISENEILTWIYDHNLLLLMISRHLGA